MEHKLWINGEWTDSQGGGKMAIEKPATGEKIAQVIDAETMGDYHITKHVMIAQS
jgi:acyl-CoA reductase-like NAD-dependent aldehyde dehydrogenase